MIRSQAQRERKREREREKVREREREFAFGDDRAQTVGAGDCREPTCRGSIPKCFQPGARGHCSLRVSPDAATSRYFWWRGVNFRSVWQLVKCFVFFSIVCGVCGELGQPRATPVMARIHFTSHGKKYLMENAHLTMVKNKDREQRFVIR